jgi:nucleotide-binding universal stress UspA family protein
MSAIMVCIDFSEVTERTVNVAVEMAKAYDVPLHVVHVRTESSGNKHVVVSDNYGVLRRARAKQESEAFKTVVTALEKTGLAVTSFIASGDIVETIVKQAGVCDPKVIVMGSHGTGAMHHLMVGSVAGGVLKQLSTPILLVPAEEHER